MILGLDTTTERLHLALVGPGPGGAAWTRWVPAAPGRSHSAALLPALQGLLAEAGAAPADLSGVVACVGPGGFTALRIGVATAEGLALTGLPTWGFSAFELRAKALRQAGCQGPVWIILDGQRQEAFLQLWQDGPVTPAMKQPVTALGAVVGDGAWWAPESFRDLVAGQLAQPPVRLPAEGEATLAGLAALCRSLPLGPPETPLVPFYLRETDAEVNFPEASAHLSEALRRGQAR
ncbi:MAG: tRNA (adenosine(37)-N6)-threonylcarbamoyltransferase complex dimerization subunit type 1 TsaB [Holophaga sp.]|nr:tRNA (adenosine(37)-N6)-threonylcarbamoyltransferase complex dimerization subunit type 1 TsaB [Holophaga sp.]